MYFGYWLKSPVGDGNTNYAFATFSDGSDSNNFTVTGDNRTLYREVDATANDLTATYEGGAAGMYVSREARLIDGVVDQFSPGTHGRFTAKAELIAKFGTHNNTMDANGAPVDETNTLGGTISEFRDGDMDLGFEVILNRSNDKSGVLVLLMMIVPTATTLPTLRQRLVIGVAERAVGKRNYSVLKSMRIPLIGKRVHSQPGLLESSMPRPLIRCPRSTTISYL